MPALRPTLTITDACSVISEAGFGGRPPGIGLELEWFVTRDAIPVTEPAVIHAAIDTGEPLPGESRSRFRRDGDGLVARQAEAVGEAFGEVDEIELHGRISRAATLITIR